MEVTAWDPVANRLAFEAYFKPIFGGVVDEGLVEELRGRLWVVLDGMEKVVGDGRRYMASDSFTL